MSVFFRYQCSSMCICGLNLPSFSAWPPILQLQQGDYKNIFKKIAARWKIPLSDVPIYIEGRVKGAPGETATAARQISN
jgi:hypothetical protein